MKNWEAESRRKDDIFRTRESEDLPEPMALAVVRPSLEGGALGFVRAGHVVAFALFFISHAEGAQPSVETVPEIRIVAPRAPRRSARETSEFSAEVLMPPARGETSLSRWLQSSPSLLSREPGADDRSGSFSIRGQDAGQSRAFLEGIPLTEAETHTAPVALLPLEMLGAAEIYSESAPVFLGEDGLGGALHFRLLAPPSGDGPPVVGARFGSFGAARVFGQGEVRLGFPARLHAGYSQAQDDFVFFDDNGTPSNASDDRWDRRSHNAVKTAVLFPEFLLHDHVRLINFNAFRESEIPGPVGVPANGLLRNRYHLVGLRYDDETGSEAVAYVRARIDDLALPNAPASVRPGRTTDTAVGARSRFDLGPWQMSGGAQIERFSLTPEVGDALERTRVSIPLAVGASLRHRALEAKPALLGHLFHYEGRGDASDYLLLSPRVGASWSESSAWALRFAAGSYYRAPSLFEIYGSSSGTAPSRDLRYERAYKAEIGGDARTRLAKTDLTISYTLAGARARDLIVFVPNSQSTQVAENIGESFLVTQEVALDARDASGLGLRLSGSWMTSGNLSPVAYEYGKELPLRPRYRSVGELSYRVDRFSVAYTLRAQSASYWDTANLKQLPANAEHGAWASFAAGDWGTFNFEIRNLTDVITAESSVGGQGTIDNTTGYPGYPAPGRRIYLSWLCEL